MKDKRTFDLTLTINASLIHKREKLNNEDKRQKMLTMRLRVLTRRGDAPKHTKRASKVCKRLTRQAKDPSYWPEKENGSP